MPSTLQFQDPAVRQLVETSIATGDRGRPVRLVFTCLSAAAGLAFLPHWLVAAFITTGLAYEFILGPLVRKLVVEGAPASTGLKGMEVRIALTAGIVGTGLYAWVAIPTWATGSVNGIVMAFAWTLGTVIHAMAYRSDRPLMLAGSLVMPILYIVIAPVFSPGGYDLTDSLALVFWFFLVLASGVFARERNVLLASARAEREAGEVARAESEAKGRFLAAMSHELRTPLNAIIGYAQLAREEMGADGRPDPADMDRIERQAEHLLGLINEILDFSKLDAGRLELYEAEIDPASVAAHVVETLLPQAQGKGITLAVRLAEGTVLPRLMLDRQRLTQCLLNLAANAVKFTETGGVTISMSVVPGPLGPLLRYQVSDTGIGIAPEDMPFLFQPFGQLDNSLTRRHEGTGLGLVITRELARRMGGDVRVTSEPGTGSTFVLEVAGIPALTQSSAQGPTQGPTQGLTQSRAA